MHCCEFCHIQFQPRNQVKNPRACLTENCQKLRQRDNEKSWKQKHLEQYDNEYHEIQREKRTKEIEDILKSILDCIKAGIRFFGKNIQFDNFTAHFSSFIFKLGIRKINKFWNLKEALNISDVEEKIT
ncbi:MAG: hypothetical protein WC711_04265 [Candidatus Staskawiczbacteria bacterium]|jgi:hypothetical protein